jgi:hypothetical protein
MSFKEYLKEKNVITEKVSDADVKKAKESAMKTAKAIFGKDFDQKKFDSTVEDLIKKNKDKVESGDELGGILNNAFKANDEEKK